MQKPKYLHAVGNVFVSVSVMPVASFINLRVQYSQQYSSVNKRVLESFPLTGLSRSSRLDSCFISQFIPVQSLTGQTTFNRQSELIKEVNGFLFNVDVDVLFFCFLFFVCYQEQAHMPMYHPTPSQARLATQLTEEEQIRIAQRIGLIQHLPKGVYDGGQDGSEKKIREWAPLVGMLTQGKVAQTPNL